MDTSKITNVLIFKDGFYYLSIHTYDEFDNVEGYAIVPDSWELYNGFEFPGDAYAYIAKLKDNTPRTTEPEE